MHLSERHNPYFEHARWKAWVAYRGRRPVGRISAQIDDLDRSYHGPDRGHFGLLEAVDDPEVFSALFRAAERWLGAEGARRVLGPFNLSINQECGLLVEGFDHPPTVMMGHGTRYYPAQLERLGYGPAKDLLAYWIEAGHPWPRAARVMLDRYARRVRTRRFDSTRMGEELELLRGLFNEAWAKNWGFVPFTEAEFTDLGKTLHLLVDDDLVQIVELDGEPAAFIVLLPNINEAIRDLHGRLLPFGWAKLLWRLKRHRIRTGRITLMGVRSQYHNTRLGAALALSAVDAVHPPGLARGMRAAELSWILEDNHGLLNILEAIGARLYKRYRIYEKLLAPGGS